MGSVLCFSSCSGDEKETAAATTSQGPTRVRTTVLAPQTLDNEIVVTGTLLPNEEVELISEIQGRVTRIDMEEGGTVRKGQVLIAIDHSDLDAELRQIEADLQLAQEDERRREQLLAVNGISQQQLDQARAQRAALEARADLLRIRISRATIRAPFNGDVGLRNVSVGGFVQPGQQLGKLVQLDPVKIDLAVPERLAHRMRSGARIEFTVEGSSGTFEGTVYAVEPHVDPATRSIKVRARAENKDKRLLPGAFVRVKVQMERIDDALMIPTEALIPDIQGQKVILVKGGKATSARVEVGIRQPREVQLVSGVNKGDTVVVTGLLALRDGMPVDPVPMVTRKEERPDTLSQAR